MKVGGGANGGRKKKQVLCITAGQKIYKKSRPKKLMKLKKFNFTKEYLEYFPYFQKDEIIWDVKQQALSALPKVRKTTNIFFIFTVGSEHFKKSRPKNP